MNGADENFADNSGILLPPLGAAGRRYMEAHHNLQQRINALVVSVDQVHKEIRFMALNPREQKLISALSELAYAVLLEHKPEEIHASAQRAVDLIEQFHLIEEYHKELSK
jgi:hypothetical protein